MLSRSGRRRRARVSMPILAEIDGCFYQSVDWSSGGFALDGDGPATPVGSEHRIKLHFELNGERYFAEVTARVVRTRGHSARAFEFVDDASGETAMLENVAKLWLTQGTGDSNAVVPVHVPTAAYPAAQPRTVLAPQHLAMPTPAPVLLKVGAKFRYYGAIVLGAGVVVAVLGYLVASRTTVYSDYAAVTGDLQVVRAAVDGLLQDSALRTGAVVQAGQVVGTVAARRDTHGHGGGEDGVGPGAGEGGPAAGATGQPKGGGTAVSSTMPGTRWPTPPRRGR